MEALSILKFWRNLTTEADVPNNAEATDEDSFFDLVFEPSENKYHFVGDAFNRTNPNMYSVNKPDSSLSFSLTLKRSPKNNDGDAARGSSLSENRDHNTTSVSRYLRLIKPLVSRKGKATEILTPFSSPVKKQLVRGGGRVGSFKIIRSSWKGRSVFPAAVRRRDDSLLEQKDGIQGAILHCKRSFSSCSSSQEYSQLFRSGSDPSHEKLNAPRRFSCQELRRCSI